MRGGIFGVIHDIFNVSVKADRIRSDGERRIKSVGFAVSAIIYALIAVALCAGGLLLLSLLINKNESALLLLIFTAAGLAVCFVGALTLFVGSLVRVIAQFSLNRRAMSWIALAVFVAALTASLIIIVKLSGIA